MQITDVQNIRPTDKNYMIRLGKTNNCKNKIRD